MRMRVVKGLWLSVAESKQKTVSQLLQDMY